MDIYKECYADSPFVRVLDGDSLATIRHVVGTNRCAISVTEVADSRRFIIVSTIDNLIKGAAGQAVQNMNVMFGLDECTGLGV
jgi:N-acetyl-gamma-glutamyl-phosphate reductase